METRVCEGCGRELTIDHFIKRRFGLSKICKDCNGKRIKAAHERNKRISELEKSIVDAKALRLKDFTPRELMEELARRGYRGKLTYTQVHEIDLNNI